MERVQDGPQRLGIVLGMSFSLAPVCGLILSIKIPSRALERRKLFHRKRSLGALSFVVMHSNRWKRMLTGFGRIPAALRSNLPRLIAFAGRLGALVVMPSNVAIHPDGFLFFTRPPTPMSSGFHESDIFQKAKAQDAALAIRNSRELLAEIGVLHLYDKSGKSGHFFQRSYDLSCNVAWAQGAE
ncbi:hypothetical protein PABG_11422 [Paracoccidioides brasiliensis Pb03]|nr:hypothetical protein PABG_11422 [Paracoccidioides brasiliensis Pb03]